MASIFYNIFSNEDILYLNELPEVTEAKAKINNESTYSVVYFNITLTENLKNSLNNCFGLDFSNISEIPMRWIKGDTKPHIDVGSTKFQNTYLAYINNSEGEFVIDNTSYPINANTAFKFNEGVSHLTTNTGEMPRLLLGPLNEFVNPVGAAGIRYYSNEADALGMGIALGTSGFTIDGVPYGYEFWSIASSSIGTSPQNVTYLNGETLIPDGNYFIYPAAPCFLEGSKILSLVEDKEEYVPIENLKKGDLVKTSLNGYKKVEIIGKGSIVNSDNSERIKERLYKCSTDNYPELTEDLYLTGLHAILVDNLTDIQRENQLKLWGDVFVTDNKCNLIACLDERAEPWSKEGEFTIWHIALENTDKHMSYGIYANGGLLVESCSLNVLENHTNMTIM